MGPLALILVGGLLYFQVDGKLFSMRFCAKPLKGFLLKILFTACISFHTIFDELKHNSTVAFSSVEFN